MKPRKRKPLRAPAVGMRGAQSVEDPALRAMLGQIQANLYAVTGRLEAVEADVTEGQAQIEQVDTDVQGPLETAAAAETGGAGTFGTDIQSVSDENLPGDSGLACQSNHEHRGVPIFTATTEEGLESEDVPATSIGRVIGSGDDNGNVYIRNPENDGWVQLPLSFSFGDDIESVSNVNDAGDSGLLCYSNHIHQAIYTATTWGGLSNTDIPATAFARVVGGGSDNGRMYVRNAANTAWESFNYLA